MATLNVLEVAVYTLVLAGGQTPLTCDHLPKREAVVCSNGTAAGHDAEGILVFDSGIEARRLLDGKLVFSNGIVTHWGSAGWVRFSNGVDVRRMLDGSFRFSTGLECRADGKLKARCDRR